MFRWRRIEQWFKHRMMRFLERKWGRPVCSPETVDWGTVRRILVVRQQDQMGDFLLATPALRALRNRFPHAHIGIVLKDYFAEAMVHSRFVDESLVFCKHGRDWTLPKIRDFWRRLRSGWDFAVVLASESHSLTSDLIAVLSGARWILGSEERPFGGCSRNFFYDLLVPAPPPDWHQSARNLAIVRYVGADTDDLSEEIHVTEAERTSLLGEWQATYARRPVVGLHIGANKSENRWPVDRFVELARRLDGEGVGALVVFWGPREGGLAKAFVQGNPPSSVYMIPPSRLRTLIVHFSLCDLLVTNDTGVMHLGAAVGTPLVAVFGPTDPAQWKPFGDACVAVRSPSGRVEDVSVDAVYAAVKERLKRLPGRDGGRHVRR